MKAFKTSNQGNLILIAFTIFALVMSCKKDENNPDYVGTWEAPGTINIDNLTMDYKDIMTFTTDSFIETGQIKNPVTNAWVNFIGIKGNVSVNGNIMNVAITEIGASAVDLISGMPTGSIIYYKSNQSEFSTLLSQIGMSAAFQSEYSVTGNNLTLKTDTNSDGDYSDDGEVTIYTRQ